MRVQELADDKELAHIIGLPFPYKLEFSQNWIATHPQSIEEGDEFPLAIVSKIDNGIVGTITIRVDKINNRGELGYWVGRDYWGQGSATEAVQEMIRFGFHHLRLNKIWASAIKRNLASIQVLKKAGLRKEGSLRQHKQLLDRYEDVEVFGLLKEDFLLKD